MEPLIDPFLPALRARRLRASRRQLGSRGGRGEPCEDRRGRRRPQRVHRRARGPGARPGRRGGRPRGPGEDLPLAGVPLAVKDHVWLAGAPATNGSRALADFVPDADCVAVSRLVSAGAVVVGKTNNPEFCYRGDTDSPLWGLTRNPWYRGRTPGGSSGGSGVAVATGMAALVIGTDGGGSSTDSLRLLRDGRPQALARARAHATRLSRLAHCRCTARWEGRFPTSPPCSR